MLSPYVFDCMSLFFDYIKKGRGIKIILSAFVNNTIPITIDKRLNSYYFVHFFL